MQPKSAPLWKSFETISDMGQRVSFEVVGMRRDCMNPNQQRTCISAEQSHQLERKYDEMYKANGRSPGLVKLVVLRVSSRSKERQHNPQLWLIHAAVVVRSPFPAIVVAVVVVVLVLFSASEIQVVLTVQ